MQAVYRPRKDTLFKTKVDKIDPGGPHVPI